MMLTYCRSSDIEQRLFDFLEDFDLWQIRSHHEDVAALTLSRETKRHHFIPGWASISSVLLDQFGKVKKLEPRLDVWCGWEWENEKEISEALLGMCFDRDIVFRPSPTETLRTV